MSSKISERHRKELLRFLLLKTAAVRGGIKPGELLRVQHCYKMRNSEGFQFCLYRRDILETMALQYRELKVDADSSLILFYHPEKLTETLNLPENRRVLANLGYPQSASPRQILDLLAEHFTQEKLPHEVGLFIGYPAKDVEGFIENLPRTPVHCGDWAVFGDARESISRMRLYRQVRKFAGDALDVCDDLQTFFDRITKLNPQYRRLTNG